MERLLIDFNLVRLLSLSAEELAQWIPPRVSFGTGRLLNKIYYCDGSESDKSQERTDLLSGSTGLINRADKL